jgi:hypothetical protein
MDSAQKLRRLGLSRAILYRLTRKNIRLGRLLALKRRCLRRPSRGFLAESRFIKEHHMGGNVRRITPNVSVMTRCDSSGLEERLRALNLDCTEFVGVQTEKL